MGSIRTVLGAAAAAALLATAPAARAQDSQGDTVVVPGSSGGADVSGGGGSTQETVVPGAAGEGRTVVIETPRAAPSVNQTVIEVGAGAETFSGRLGDQLQGGAGWTGRLIFGAKSPLGMELGYTGAVNPVEGQGISNALGDVGDLSSNNSVTTNQGEALLRANLAGARSRVIPFVAGGANYTRMDSSTGILDNVDAVGIPFAAGLQFYPVSNFTIGARGDYKILTRWIDSIPSGNQWGGMLTVGANF
jgi:hypothetical protein